MFTNKKGFTIIELLISLVILGIVTLAMVKTFGDFNKISRLTIATIAKMQNAKAAMDEMSQKLRSICRTEYGYQTTLNPADFPWLYVVDISNESAQTNDPIPSTDTGCHGIRFACVMNVTTDYRDDTRYGYGVFHDDNRGYYLLGQKKRNMASGSTWYLCSLGQTSAGPVSSNIHAILFEFIDDGYNFNISDLHDYDPVSGTNWTNNVIPAGIEIKVAAADYEDKDPEWFSTFIHIRH